MSGSSAKFHLVIFYHNIGFIGYDVGSFAAPNIFYFIAKGNVVYLIFGVEISNDIKVDNETKNIFYANIKAD